MTMSRWVVSAFIAWHLVSIGVSSLPTGSRLERAAQPSGPFPLVTRAADVISAGITTAAATLQRTSMWAMASLGCYVNDGNRKTWASSGTSLSRPVLAGAITSRSCDRP